MSLTLARFSQEVDVATGSLDVTYFAIFRSGDGRELKLPISEEASQAIISFYADKKEKVAEVPEPQEEPDATTFGGDDYVPPPDPDEEPPQQEEPEPEDAPSSEEQVPSL